MKEKLRDIAVRPGTALKLRVLTFLTLVAGAVAGFFASLDPAATGLRIVGVGCAIAVALVALLSWWADDVAKRDKEGRAKTLEAELEAERVRFTFMTNAAFLPTLKTLQDFAGSDLNERKSEISGLRQDIVARVGDLVRGVPYRAAYFTVQDLRSSWRIMKSQHVSHRERTDEFTTEFDETTTVGREVFGLIDHESSAKLVDDIHIPGKLYRAYISAPVRAGGIPFGMLTVNVLEPGGLTPEDRDSILWLSRILATAEIMALSPTIRHQLAEVSDSRSTMQEEGS